MKPRQARPASNHLPPARTAAAASGPRARLAAAARAHFLRFGFARCSMDCIAAEVGMSKKTVYRHFRSKEALVEAVIEAKIAGFRAGLDAIMTDGQLDFPERARRVAAHIAGQMGEIAPVFLRDLERLLPALHARIEAVRREVLPRTWCRILEEGVARGHVREGPPPAFVAELLLASAEGLLRPAVLQRMDLAPGAVARDVLATVLGGILTPAGRRACGVL